MSKSGLISDRAVERAKPIFSLRALWKDRVPETHIHPAYFSRVFNRADSAIHPQKLTSVRKQKQANGETFQVALRKLAADLCLEKVAGKREECLKESRDLVDEEFIDWLAEDGVRLERDGDNWTWHEDETVQNAAKNRRARETAPAAEEDNVEQE